MVTYFSICGAGETTLQNEIADITYSILKNGHYVNIITNGTIEKRLKEIVEKAGEYVSHLHFAFSLHYLELKRLGLLNTFFDNVNMVRAAGASIMVQINLCDEYIPYLQEIEDICIERVGEKPQVAATRKEEKVLQKIELLTEHTEAEYQKYGEEFDSPQFRFTMKNFNVKRKEFCYAGDWAGNLDLSNGRLRRCYSSYVFQDIFKNPDEPIRFLAMVTHCGSPFCMNSSHFMSLGVIPEIETPSYAELRNREEAGWHTEDMKEFLSGRLYDSNEKYALTKKLESNIVGVYDDLLRFGVRTVKGFRRR
ncbi:radical SAM protein [Pygmaiobacter massiliensis]|uniref:radical SAM protein n=1 Tax=Pygmaiobacter massiliensis TaxID=1917873 RepID=UPI000C7E1AE0|nr:radical SAM protein [Pygmaiobacter massiliensis]